MNADQLATRFRIPGIVEFAESAAGLAKVTVSPASCTGELYLQGAQVTAWQPAGERPVIFTSPNAVFAPGKAIRGGIPVIFPWFGAHPSQPGAPQHGFARVAAWRLDRVEQAGADAVALDLSLASDGKLDPHWPQEYAAVLRVTFGRELSLDLAVRNRASHEIVYEEALHTYFAISAIADVSVGGLEQSGFIDKTQNMARTPPAGAPLVVRGETDSVYLDTGATLVLRDPGWRRRITVAKTGAASAIVWNPWAEKAAAMADLGGEAWRSMICVETGNVADNRVRLAAGAEHRMTTRIAVDAGG